MAPSRKSAYLESGRGLRRAGTSGGADMSHDHTRADGRATLLSHHARRSGPTASISVASPSQRRGWLRAERRAEQCTGVMGASSRLLVSMRLDTTAVVSCPVGTLLLSLWAS